MTRAGGRDHGGGVDAAAARHGGARADWLDMSTGINPRPYPVGGVDARAWTDLPDAGAEAAFVDAARAFWGVPDGADVLPAPGASALIARLPALLPAARVVIPGPTYNEHAAAFRAHGWDVVETGPAEAFVAVHPNNPDGRLWGAGDLPDVALTVIDESFCDVMPEVSLTPLAVRPGVVILKSFGKFWGLAGLRLGASIGAPDTLARLAEMLGPWPVSGPALEIGMRALRDLDWAAATRARLVDNADRLDTLMTGTGAEVLGGTALFRLYAVADAATVADRLAQARILVRTFPYNPRWLRLGLPGDTAGFSRLEDAL